MFKIGDTVRLKTDLTNAKVGYIGTILAYNEDYTSYDVEFSLIGVEKYVMDTELELAPDENESNSRKQVLAYKVDVTEHFEFDKSTTLDNFAAIVTTAVQKLKKNYLKGDITSHKLVKDYYGYDGGYDGGFNLDLHLFRLENDIEYEKRLEKERQKADKLAVKHAEKEAKVKAEYERLKAKFGE